MWHSSHLTIWEQGLSQCHYLDVTAWEELQRTESQMISTPRELSRFEYSVTVTENRLRRTFTYAYSTYHSILHYGLWPCMWSYDWIEWLWKFGTRKRFLITQQLTQNQTHNISVIWLHWTWHTTLTSACQKHSSVRVKTIVYYELTCFDCSHKVLCTYKNIRI